jgi:hypothetical protein
MPSGEQSEALGVVSTAPSAVSDYLTGPIAECQERAITVSSLPSHENISITASVESSRCRTSLDCDNSRIQKNHRVSLIDCKQNSAGSESNYVFRHNPHMRRIRRILRPLSRIRAELAGEFSLAIR